MISGKNKNLWLASGMLGLSMLAANAQAALITVTTGTAAGQAVYDDVANLTWIKNAELARTELFGLTEGTVDSNGRMTWANALAWVAGMNDANYLGFNDWRLPETPREDPSCSAQLSFPPLGWQWNCKGSELGSLYRSLLGVAPDEDLTQATSPSITTSPLLQGPNPIFTIPQFPEAYWSGTEYAFDPTGQAMAFQMNTGYQRFGGKNNLWSVWAVRTGDAGDVAAVPEPGTLALFGMGLLGLLGLGRAGRPLRLRFFG